MTKIEPYAAGKLTKSLYAKKSEVRGALAVVLNGRMEERGLELIAPVSRCVRKEDVHELILTDEQSAKPGCRVDRIAYLGFCVIDSSGVIIEGDEVYLQDRLIGHLAGFDETHMPNHLNIVIRTAQLAAGTELGADTGMSIAFRHVPQG